MANRKRKDESYNIREIFQEMELELIRSMKRNLTRHQKEEAKQGFKFEQWQSVKLRELERFRKENKAIIGKYSEDIEELINTTLVETYQKSQDSVNEFIKEIKNAYVDDVLVKLPGDLEPIPQTPIESELMEDMISEVLENVRVWDDAPTPRDETFFRTNDHKFDALMETVENDFKKANFAVLRRMDDIYRQTIFKAQVPYNTGTVTLDQAIDAATKDFLEKGIDAITYSDGKKVNIASYAEMAFRTANHRSYLMAEGKKRQEMGLSLVVVSAHATACELCVPWQGLILIDDIYSGGTQADGPYPLLSQAMEEGLMHPNCRHNLSTYFPGITTLPKVPDADKALENYKYEQQQRHIERQIRKYKRLAEGSIDENNQKRYQDKIKELQGSMREHLKENPQLRRAYSKEQTKGIPYDYSEYDKLGEVVTKESIPIRGISQHLKERAVERNISANNIKDSLENPLKIGKIKKKDNGNSQEYIGENARVIINPDTGNIITVWKTSSKLRSKLKDGE